VSKIQGAASRSVGVMSNAQPHHLQYSPLNDLLAGTSSLMTVWAHPDDESFLAAGAMHTVAANGGRVVNVSATLGELGTADPESWPPERLARRRRAELARALAHLGGAEMELLGLSDGSCEHLDDRMGARRIATVIEAVQPDLIVTFGPCGVTGHPDHQAIHRWTHRAVDAVDPRIPVLSVVTAAAWPDDLIEPLHEVGAFFPGYPEQDASINDLHITLDETTLEAKLAALLSHESQIGPILEHLGPDDFRRLFAAEAYRPTNFAARLAVGAPDLLPLAAA
ncbi:MAG: PIG-L family deacetylase, partial [Actinomycetota bacterium]